MKDITTNKQYIYITNRNSWVIILKLDRKENSSIIEYISYSTKLNNNINGMNTT